MNTFLQGRLALATCALLMAQAAVAAADPPGETGSAVVASGTVPDEAARAAILGKLRSIYGHQRVIDRLEVGGVIPPPDGPTGSAPRSTTRSGRSATVVSK